MFNYSQICSDLLGDLPQRTKDVILRRFGLETDKRETLETIGKSYGITRERVRQIQENGLLKVRPKFEKKNQKIFQHFTDQFKITGDLRKEDILLNFLGGQKFQNHIFFLLTLGDPFFRFPETEDYYSLWTINPRSLTLAQKVIHSFYQKLSQTNQLLNLKDYKTSFSDLASQSLLSYLEISKQIQQNPEGLFGLKNWPEINPRGVKDKAYLVLKREARPLHFTEIAQLIGEPNLGWEFSPPNPQSVHNELIRDSRFVLVGRGLYALKEWGYIPGIVKDIILEILKETKRPLSKKEIVEKVLKQRLVKENTILLNLSNKKYFLRTPEGKYTLREN